MNLAHLFSKTPKGQPPNAVEALRPPFIVESFGLSDRGHVRRSNEDCFVVAELTRTLQINHSNLLQDKATFSCHRGHVFLVADGVGGSKAGEVASGLSERASRSSY
jgi:PPM family protein phosphatase